MNKTQWENLTNALCFIVDLIDCRTNQRDDVKHDTEFLKDIMNYKPRNQSAADVIDDLIHFTP